MSTDPTAISRPRPQLLIPGYHLVELIGQGGMGEVHRAIQLSLGRTVAVKLLSANLAQDESFVARFEKEAAALAALSHPNIVSIVDKGHSGNTYFLVMEYVNGPSLRDLMGQKGGLESPRALKIALDICRAIDYAHGRGIIHRDLKPENILFDEQAGSIPKVSDFGLASFTDGDSKFNLTQTHVGMGTLSYMAPEQHNNAKNADHRADIYSLGVMLYELLVGELPVGTFEPPSRKRPGLDRRLDAIVMRCLKPAPADRYQKVSDIIAELEPLLPIHSHLTMPPKVTGMQRAWIKVARVLRGVARAVEVAVVLAAVAVLGVVALRMRYPGPAKLPVAQAITQEVDAKGSFVVPARVSYEPSFLHHASVGNGPDSVSLTMWGRGTRFDAGTLSFEPVKWPLTSIAPPEPKASFGKFRVDLADRGGWAVRVAAELKVRAPEPSTLGRLRDLALGVTHESRATLALISDPAHYVAVTLSGAGAPVSLEWSLPDHHGTLLGQASPPEGSPVQVELQLDGKGFLNAFMGSGSDRRQVGEPIQLGAGLKSRFGRTPYAVAACIDGDCQVRRLVMELPRTYAAAEQLFATPPSDDVPVNPAAAEPGGASGAEGTGKPVASAAEQGSAPAAGTAKPGVVAPAIAKAKEPAPVSIRQPPPPVHKPVAKTAPPPPPVKKPVAPVHPPVKPVVPVKKR